MIRKVVGFTCLLGALTIIVGAFGAHSLKERLPPESLESFETGVRYLMYHVLAILLITNSQRIEEKPKLTISYFFIAGIFFFSGSIFLIALNLVSASQIWFITPLGGLLFILGWLISAWSFFKSTDNN